MPGNPNPDWTPKYTEEEKAQVREFILAGNSPKEIAEAVGVPISMVSNLKYVMRKKGEIDPVPQRATLTKPGEEPNGQHFVSVAEDNATKEKARGDLLRVIQDQRVEIQNLKDLLRRYMK